MATENPSYIKGLDQRQMPASIFIELTDADFDARSNVIDIASPPGTQVVLGDFVVVTPGNDTGTETIKIGDSVTTDRYLAATNAKAAAGTRTALTATGYLYPGGGATAAPFIRITRTPQNANGTAGRWRFHINYVQLGKSDWTEG